MEIYRFLFHPYHSSLFKMTRLSTVQVIPFYGKSEERQTWSEKVLAKAKSYGFNDALLGNLKIFMADEVFDIYSEEGKNKLVAVDANKLACTELILPNDDKTSDEMVAFTSVQGCKSKHYIDDNAFIV
jgi:hypothetical protein